MIRFRTQRHIVITISPKAKCVIDYTAMLFNILQKKIHFKNWTTYCWKVFFFTHFLLYCQCR